MDFCRTFNLTQQIKNYTSSSKPAIDLILDQENQSQSGVLESGLSDHYMIYCTRNITCLPINRHNHVKMRMMRDYSKDNFKSKLNVIV